MAGPLRYLVQKVFNRSPLDDTVHDCEGSIKSRNLSDGGGLEWRKFLLCQLTLEAVNRRPCEAEIAQTAQLIFKQVMKEFKPRLSKSVGLLMQGGKRTKAKEGKKSKGGKREKGKGKKARRAKRKAAKEGRKAKKGK